MIWKFLKAGYMEDWTIIDTYSGVPQGAGCSPVLCNIYLNEFDKFVEAKMRDFDTMDRPRKLGKEYAQFAQQAYRLRKKIAAEPDGERREEMIAKHKAIQRQLIQTNPNMPDYSGRKQFRYVRYADDFLICVSGTKEDAEKIKEEIAEYLSKELKLELSLEKTLITHTSQRAKFLGYEISISKSQDVKRTARGCLQRVYYGQVRLFMPRNIVRDRLLKYGAIKIQKNMEKEQWKPMPRLRVAQLNPSLIVNTYNSEIRGLYNYYRMACNVCNLWNFGRGMYHSCIKTLASKYRCKIREIKQRYVRNGTIVIPWKSKKGEDRTTEFYKEGYRKSSTPMKELADYCVSTQQTWKREITRRLLSGICELCGKPEKALKVYLVRKLKDLGDTWLWERRMKSIRRKSLMVCPTCYQEILQGTSCKIMN